MTTTTTNPTNPTADTQLAAKRIAREYKRRHIAVWNVETGELISDRGNGVTLAPRTPLSTVLDMLTNVPASQQVRMLYIIGGKSAANTPKRAWWAEPATLPADGLSGVPWRFDGYEIAARAAGGADATQNAGTYQRGDVTIDVRMSALWFPGIISPREWRDSWNALQLALARTFDSAAALLATPAATGLDLLERSLPAGVRYPLAPQELRDLLYGISGQGRFEFCPSPDAPAVLPGLWWLDARWMYAACVRNLPTGTPAHFSFGGGADADEGYLDHQPGWYRVDVQVPRNWGHRGLIATRRDGERVWPCEPGEWLRDVWTSGAELAVALRNGWPCLIYERWAYERQAVGYALPDPTRTWAANLRTLRSDYAHSPAIAAALRHMLIDTVGMWHRRAGEKLRITPLADVGAGVRVHHVDRRAGLAYWYEAKPLGRSALPWQRPEWSATVWNRAAARENTAALRLPVEMLVAYRSDALVVCERPAPAAWLDDGQPGTFRLKGHIPGPLAMPADAAALLALRSEREGE